MIDLKELKKKCQEFDELEEKGSFYDMARNLVENGFEIEGYIIISATWNRREFAKASSEFPLNEFRRVAEEDCKLLFQKLDGLRFEDVNFDDIRSEIIQLYDILSEFRGIKYVGASKIMHLKNPQLFVMWDTNIRQFYRIWDTKAENYLKFLKKMQEISNHIKWTDKRKTLAKVIDEYNFMKFTYS